MSQFGSVNIIQGIKFKVLSLVLLLRIEKTDIMDGTLETHINLTSSLLEYQIDVSGKSAPGGPSTLDGRLRVDSRVSDRLEKGSWVKIWFKILMQLCSRPRTRVP